MMHRIMLVYSHVHLLAFVIPQFQQSRITSDQNFISEKYKTEPSIAALVKSGCAYNLYV